MSRYTRLHPIKRRLLDLHYNIRATTSNIQEPWVQNYPTLRKQLQSGLQRQLRARRILEWEYLRRKLGI